MANKKPLSRIKEGVFSRGLALAKLSVTAGVKAASHVVGNAFANAPGKIYTDIPGLTGRAMLMAVGSSSEFMVRLDEDWGDA